MKYKIKKENLAINLTPMIDVVFLLLIFFLVSSTLNINEPVRTINLPESYVTSTKNTAMSISVDAENNYYFNGNKITEIILEKKLQSLSASKRKELAFYADQKTDFQAIIQLMDILERYGYADINFRIKGIKNNELSP